MAKRSSKKSELAMVLNILVIVFAVLTIITLFIPVIKVTATAMFTESTVTIKGTDVFTAAFANETPDGGAAILYSLRNSESNGFVTSVYLWTYMLTVLVALASGVFAVLNICGLQFRLVNTILGIALLVLALITFILAFVVAGYTNGTIFGVGYKNGRAAFGSYCLLGTLLAGCCEVYNARK